MSRNINQIFYLLIAWGGFSKEDFDDLMNDSSFDTDNNNGPNITVKRKMSNSNTATVQEDQQQSTTTKQRPLRGKYVFKLNKLY